MSYRGEVYIYVHRSQREGRGRKKYMSGKYGFMKKRELRNVCDVIM
jgi:hypothetical protein